MAVTRIEEEIVLGDRRRNPEVVGGKGSTLPAQLAEKPGIVVSGLLIGVQDFNPGRVEKAGQDTFVLLRPATAQKPGPEFSQGPGVQPR